MPSTYIIYSKKLNKFYVGATTNSAEQRLVKHNSAAYDSLNFTARANDWKLFLEINASDFNHAVRMERKIKSMKSRTYILNLKKYPELLDKLITNSQL